MDELRQKLEAQFNAYLNSSTPQAKMINKPPAKEDVDRVLHLARVPPQRMNIISQSIYDRNRNWVFFVLSRYTEQMKVFEESGYRYRLYTPEMLGKKPLTALGEKGLTRAPVGLTPAQEAQRRINRQLHGVAEGGAIPEGVATGKLAPMGASEPESRPAAVPKAAAAPAVAANPAVQAPRPPGEAPAPRVQRKVIIRRIIKKKADGTQEVIEQRTVVEVPIGEAAVAVAAKPNTTAPAPPAKTPAAPAVAAPPARPAPVPAPPARTAPNPAPKPPVTRPAPAKPDSRPVDREIDDFFKKYNLK